MKKLLQGISIPFAGVSLGLAGLGNLLQSYSEGVRIICGVLSAIFLLLLILKIIIYPKKFVEDMKNPVMASISATFPMALMLLSVYAKPYIGAVSQYIWFFAIALHILLIIYFTMQFIVKFDIKKVFASYFIVYAGLAVASLSAPAYGMQNIGTIAFWVAFIPYLILLVPVSYRYIRYTEIAEPAQPLFCIFTAPLSLCLAGYMQSVEPKSFGLVVFMAVLSMIFYILVLIRLPRYLKLKFYPSYAAFTFPLVISAIAMKMTAGYLTKIGMGFPLLNYVVIVQTIIATALVVYVVIRFVMHLYETVSVSEMKEKKEPAK